MRHQTDAQTVDSVRADLQREHVATHIHNLITHTSSYLYVLGVVWESGGEFHEGCEGVLPPHWLDGGARQHCLQHLHQLLAAH